MTEYTLFNQLKNGGRLDATRLKALLESELEQRQHEKGVAPRETFSSLEQQSENIIAVLSEAFADLRLSEAIRAGDEEQSRLDQLMSVAEVTEETRKRGHHITRQTVYNHMRSAKLLSAKVRGKTVIRYADFLKWLEIL